LTPRTKRRCWLAALAALGGLVSLVANLTGLRLWTRFGPAANAPVVALSVGADVINDVGIHQAPYQATLAALGARVLEINRRDGRTPGEILEGADCLLLTGGGDVDPRLYGGDAGGGVLVDRPRDTFEIALIREALRRDMPVLAVCRGHQLLNVAYGGTLRDARLDPVVGRTHGITARSLVAHEVFMAEGSRVRAAAGGARVQDVSSFHGVVVDRVGLGLTPTAVAPDGVVEAFEVEGATYAVSVQWHPELVGVADPASRKLFEGFLKEAKRYRRAPKAPRSL